MFMGCAAALCCAVVSSTGCNSNSGGQLTKEDFKPTPEPQSAKILKAALAEGVTPQQYEKEHGLNVPLRPTY